jgi:glutathione S-transferase
LKLYDCQTAPSPRRVRIFLAEKGIEFEKVEVNLSSGEQFGPAFRRINPDCVVPVLELDDGSAITEVLAICHYLEEEFPEPPLFGSTPESRARAIEWNAKVEQQGLWAAADLFRNTARGLRGHALPGPIGYEQIPELAERGRQRVGACLLRLNEQLQKESFVAGDAFTIADITAMVLVDFAAWSKIKLPADAVDLQRWYEAVSSRPSARA